jgi:hypothetical protein
MSFLSLKKSHKPWSGVPVTFSVMGTGFGGWSPDPFLDRTESVCLFRRPVPRTADTPLLELLSFLHLMGDVENRAAGALRMHWAEGTRKARTDSVALIDAALGRIIRLCMVAIVLLDCASLTAGRRICACCGSLRQKLKTVARAQPTEVTMEPDQIRLEELTC